MLTIQTHVGDFDIVTADAGKCFHTTVKAPDGGEIPSLASDAADPTEAVRYHAYCVQALAR